jgi:hypothetical protein
MTGRAGARARIIGSALACSLEALLVIRRRRRLAAYPSARFGCRSAFLWASPSGFDVFSLRDPEVVKREKQVSDRPVSATRRD